MEVPVVCYGLRADFQNNLFEGSQRLIAIADTISEVKTVCWCGKKATCNARYNKQGIVRDGEQVFLGANDSYVALCRKHFKLGMLGPNIENDVEDYRVYTLPIQRHGCSYWSYGRQGHL